MSRTSLIILGTGIGSYHYIRTFQYFIHLIFLSYHADSAFMRIMISKLIKCFLIQALPAILPCPGHNTTVIPVPFFKTILIKYSASYFRCKRTVQTAVYGNIKPFPHSRLYHMERLRGHPQSKHISQVGDIYRRSRLSADIDRLLQRSKAGIAVLSCVNGNNFIISSGHPRQLQHLLKGASRYIFESEGEAVYSAFHSLCGKLLHAGNLLRCRSSVAVGISRKNTQRRMSHLLKLIDQKSLPLLLL